MQSMHSIASDEWATGHSVGEPYPSTEMQSVYSAAPDEWDTGHSLGEPHISAEKQSVYSTSLATGPQDTRWWILAPLQRCKSVYSTAPDEWDTGHSLGEPHISAEKQSVYSTSLATGTQDTCWGSLNPPKRCSRCILQSKMTGPQDTHCRGHTPLQRCSAYILLSQNDWATGHSLGEPYLSAEKQLVHSIDLEDWTTGQSLAESFPSTEMQSLHFTASDDEATGHSLGE